VPLPAATRNALPGIGASNFERTRACHSDWRGMLWCIHMIIRQRSNNIFGKNSSTAFGKNSSSMPRQHGNVLPKKLWSAASQLWPSCVQTWGARNVLCRRHNSHIEWNWKRQCS
jgi:hypothetical protein